jgi:hypothetical protein
VNFTLYIYISSFVLNNNNNINPFIPFLPIISLYPNKVELIQAFSIPLSYLIGGIL